jgi:hypothetical protein
MLYHARPAWAGLLEEDGHTGLRSIGWLAGWLAGGLVGWWRDGVVALPG